jgi:flagellar protein FliO/FliZ
MDISLFSLFLRLTVSLGVVLVLVRLAAGLLQRSTGGSMRRRRGPAEVEVLLRQPVGRRASIAVVRAGGRGLVLGVTEHTITLLAEDEPDVLVPLALETPRTASPADGRASASPTWTAVVDALRDRTARRS